MAYVIVSEAEAAAAEHTRDALGRIKAALDANAATLKAGDRAVTPGTIYLGAQQALGQFPAIQIEATEAEEMAYTLGGGSENLLRLSFRIFGYDLELGRTGVLAQNLIQFSDRIQTVLRRNPTLDGFCRDLIIRRVVFGRLRGGPRTANPIFAPHPLLATQIDAVIEKVIARP